ncbi:FixH family protein [Massilia sp. GCM10020059]|uniref:FixH family protein n=1 Tax=Massilia agrisoli TaxID=2892444 RepID=A0ABS8IUH4_9BURK|nr:FixH family protein [Massilia agrisoli]MCC6072264.1 FixH family protein [Massilia agrisoli]
MTLNPKEQAAARRPWYTHRWPWLLMLGPALVLVAGAITGYLAVTREDAVVVDDYYKKGKAINQDLRRDKVASSMQLAFAARHDPAAGTLEGVLTSRGQPVTAPFRIRLAHSTQPKKDMVLEAVPGPGGRFTASLPVLEQARWRVVVEGPANDWRLAGTWQWPQERALELRADPEAAK